MVADQCYTHRGRRRAEYAENRDVAGARLRESLTATWTAPATDSTHNAATGFNLRSSPTGVGTWTTVSGVTSPYTLARLAVGAAYDVQVQGSNAAGVSAWSATRTATTSSAGPFAPNAPAIASVATTPDGTAGKLVVAWPAPAVDATHGAATGYNLRSSPTGAGTWTTVSGATTLVSHRPDQGRGVRHRSPGDGQSPRRIERVVASS